MCVRLAAPTGWAPAGFRPPARWAGLAGWRGAAPRRPGYPHLGWTAPAGVQISPNRARARDLGYISASPALICAGLAELGSFDEFCTVGDGFGPPGVVRRSGTPWTPRRPPAPTVWTPRRPPAGDGSGPACRPVGDGLDDPASAGPPRLGPPRRPPAGDGPDPRVRRPGNGSDPRHHRSRTGRTSAAACRGRLALRGSVPPAPRTPTRPR